MLHQLDRAQAAGLTRVAQAGFLVLAGGTVALAAISLPAAPGIPPDVAPEAAATTQTPAAGEKSPQDAAAKVDTGAVAMRLGFLGNSPKRKTAEPAAVSTPDETGATRTATPAPTAPPAEALRYLGALREGERMLALLAVEGVQKIVRAEDTLELKGAGSKVRVIEIKPEEVVLEENGARRTITKAARSTQRVTMGSAAGGRAGAGAGASAVNPAAFSYTAVVPQPVSGAVTMRVAEQPDPRTKSKQERMLADRLLAEQQQGRTLSEEDKKMIERAIAGSEEGGGG